MRTQGLIRAEETASNCIELVSVASPKLVVAEIVNGEDETTDEDRDNASHIILLWNTNEMKLTGE